MDAGGLERFVQRHRREDGGEPPGQHGLPGTGRPDHQQVVPAGGGNLQCPLGRSLAADVSQVGVSGRRGTRVQVGADGAELAGPADEGTHLRERRGAAGLNALDHGGLGGVGGRQHHAAAARRPGAQGDGQRAAHRPEIALETQLADDEIAVEPPGRELAAGEQDAERDREIERRACLRAIRGREIARDALERERESRAGERGGHPLSAFLYGALRQTDRGERRQPVGEVNLHLDGVGVDPDDGCGSEMGQHERSQAEHRKLGRRRQGIVTRKLRIDAENARIQRMVSAPFRVDPRPYVL